MPLGVFLSGGIDSGLVTALAARVSPDPVKTFTISFRDTPLDESAYARQVSERYGTQHTETVLEPDALGIDLVQRLGAHFDEPFADASAIPMYLLSETTRAHVTVALSGDGGDELFAGYQLNQSYTRIAAMQSAVPRMLRPAVSATARHGIEPLARLLRSERLRRVAKAGGWVGSSPLDLIVQLGSYWVDREKRRLYGPRMKDVAIGEHAGCWMARRCGEWPVRPDLKTCLYAELRTTLADDMLVKADRMSMYHALEIRVPLLDHHVVEHAFSLDADEFLRGSTGKLPLRDLARRLLPEGLVDRPKQGFHVPLESLGGDKLASFARDTLNSDRMRRDGFFAPEAAEELIVAYEDRHERGRGNVSRYQINHRLWSLLMFTMWLDSWSGGSPSAADRPRAIDVGSGVM